MANKQIAKYILQNTHHILFFMATSPILFLVSFQRLCDFLLPMYDTYLDAELLVDMLGQVLGRVDGAVLTASTAKAEHQ